VTHETTDPGSPRLRLAAVGDLLLPCDPCRRVPDRAARGLFEGITDVFDGFDVVFGNLEATLAGDGATVPTEPRVVTSPDLVTAVVRAGFTHVTLANNHAFDCLQPGFETTRRFVREAGVACFGAGRDLADASAPAFAEAAGLRIAFLGVVDDLAGASHYADDQHCGVAPLEINRLQTRIADLATQVDHVIVSPHWGEERFDVPSPVQIEQAHAMVDAGASMVLGHHPHVLQGLEIYRGAPIVYSLGNFLASTVYWTDGDVLTWNRTEQTGCILRVEMTRDSVEVIDQVPTYDDGTGVRVDRSPFGARRIARVNRCLARGVTLKRYRRERLRVKTLKPILARLKWSEFRKIRWRHIRKVFQGFFRADKAG